MKGQSSDSSLIGPSSDSSLVFLPTWTGERKGQAKSPTKVIWGEGDGRDGVWQGRSLPNWSGGRVGKGRSRSPTNLTWGAGWGRVGMEWCGISGKGESPTKLTHGWGGVAAPTNLIRGVIWGGDGSPTNLTERVVTCHYSPSEQTDTRAWKHYLPTLNMVGKNPYDFQHWW